MDALEALCYGFKFEELVENINDLPALYNNRENGKKQQYPENYCKKCKIEMTIIDGIYICDKCGIVGDNVVVNEWIENIWLHRNKSKYVRNRNIRNSIEKYVHKSMFVMFLKTSFWLLKF